MSLDSALASGRRAAEARMLSRATVRRKTGTNTLDADGFEVPAWVAAYTDRPCRIAGMSGNTSPYRTVNVGGASLELAARVAHFAHDTVVRDSDYIEVTAGELAGSVWQVIEADAADQQTARRVPVIAAERPEEWS